MPKIKVEREDIIRKEELDDILEDLGKIDYRGIKGDGWQCLFAMLWVFGKRISEVICLKTSEIFIQDDELWARFHVLKKKSRSDTGVKLPFTKQISLENEYVDYILPYWRRMVKQKEVFLFPRPQTKTGHIYREYVRDVIKMIGANIYIHLMRHSLATTMAEKGATAYEMVNWFDWDRTDTALEYIKRSGRLTERLSKRVW